jgi:hypothetical protein
MAATQLLNTEYCPVLPSLSAFVLKLAHAYLLKMQLSVSMASVVLRLDITFLGCRSTSLVVLPCCIGTHLSLYVCSFV